MVLLNAGLLKSGVYLNLHSVPELHSPIERVNGSIRLSALTTYAESRRHPEIRRILPMLPRAAREIGAIQIQSRGTWAGNIVNASPAADGVPALMAYDASIDLASSAATRCVSLADFYRGYKQMDRRPDELITAIRVPIPNPGTREYYRKVGTRKFQAISKVLLAGVLQLGTDRRIEHVRLVYASVMPTTYRARKTEEVLLGQELTPGLARRAVESVREELNPITDIRSTASYRLSVACNLLRDFLEPAV